MKSAPIVCLVLLVPTLLAAAASPSDGDWPVLTLKCGRAGGVQAKDVVLEVQDYSIAENCLQVVLTVANKGTESIVLPTRNSEFALFGAEIFNSKGEPVSYCGGVRYLEENGFDLDLPTSNDFLTVLAGEEGTIDPGCLAPFWPYLREEDYDAASFAATYTFYEPQVQVPPGRAREFESKLASIRSTYCRLLRAEIVSKRIPIDWSHYTPDRP